MFNNNNTLNNNNPSNGISNITSNNPFTQYQSYQNSSNVEYYDEEFRNIIKKSRQNERYRLPIHANYYKWGKDIRPYLPYFAGIGVEKLYLFYTHALDLFVHYDNSYVQTQIWKDMLTMVQDPLFRRKLRKLEKFTENDFKYMQSSFDGYVVMGYGQTMFGFDRKQLLYFIVDIAVNALNNVFFDKKGGDKMDMDILEYSHIKYVLLEYIFTGIQKWSIEDRLHVLKTVYTRKVKTLNINKNNNNDDNTNINHESFLYELDIEKLKQDAFIIFLDMPYDGKRFQKVVLDKLETIITVDEETQTEEIN